MCTSTEVQILTQTVLLGGVVLRSFRCLGIQRLSVASSLPIRYYFTELRLCFTHASFILDCFAQAVLIRRLSADCFTDAALLYSCFAFPDVVRLYLCFTHALLPQVLVMSLKKEAELSCFTHALRMLCCFTHALLMLYSWFTTLLMLYAEDCLA